MRCNAMQVTNALPACATTEPQSERTNDLLLTLHVSWYPTALQDICRSPDARRSNGSSQDLAACNRSPGARQRLRDLCLIVVQLFDVNYPQLVFWGSKCVTSGDVGIIPSPWGEGLDSFQRNQVSGKCGLWSDLVGVTFSCLASRREGFRWNRPRVGTCI